MAGLILNSRMKVRIPTPYVSCTSTIQYKGEGRRMWDKEE
jgi:hypothetical protein